ncbi:MAG: hypothetical protein ACI4K7_03500 [Oscillospiraceae bacterium]
MHKLFHINEKKLAYRFDRTQLILNIPVFAAAAALLVIVNVVMRLLSAPMELYRAVIYAVFFITAYSFIVALFITVISTGSIRANKKYSFIEITGGSIVFSQHEKTVRTRKGKKEYVKMWVMRLSDVEDVGTSGSCLVIKGKARYFCLPEDWLKYSVNENGSIEFERWWNDSYGGQIVHSVKIKDNYTFGERILRRILLCAEKQKITEQRREEFRRRMLTIAASMDKKRGIAPKYKEPPVRLPREGIKERKW